MVGRVKQPAKGKVAWSILTTLLTLLAFFCASHTQAGESARPNVVFMLADNLGYGDLGVYGGGETRGFRTPRIDRLAGEGLRFTQFLVEPGSHEGGPTHWAIFDSVRVVAGNCSRHT